MMVVADELLGLDATGQAELVARGEVSAIERVEVAAARLAAVNRALNAVIHPSVDRARWAAVGRLPEGPFTGVPFLIKDLIVHAANEPFHEGIRALADRGFREDRDTRLVELFEAVGLVSIGRTNRSELGLYPGSRSGGSGYAAPGTVLTGGFTVSGDTTISACVPTRSAA